MSSEKLLAGEYEPVARSSSYMNWTSEQTGIFEQLPKATIVSVSKPDASDFSPLLLSYTIQLQYKQVSFLHSLSLCLLSLFTSYNFNLIQVIGYIIIQVIFMHIKTRQLCIWLFKDVWLVGLR